MAAPGASALLRLESGWRCPLWAGGPAALALTLVAAPMASVGCTVPAVATCGLQGAVPFA